MSHVDDGTLHAFLDGELSPVETERLTAHLAGCSSCQARLDEERALIERAARLLGAAVPAGPGRVPPPLHQLRRSRSMWRLKVPLAWAATIVLALGLGWFGGTRGSRRMPSSTAAEPATVALDQARAPVSQAESRSATPAGGRLAKASDAEQGSPSAQSASGALADRPARDESDERQSARAAERLPAGQAPPALRGAAPSAPVASSAIVVQQDAPAFAAREATLDRLSTTWPVIEPKPAHDLLGAAPMVIPGYSVRALRRNPNAAPEIVVEQEIASGVVVSLFERPINVDSQAKPLNGFFTRADSLTARARANERLARFVRGLRIEISGPLSTDSLSKLLELVSP